MASMVIGHETGMLALVAVLMVLALGLAAALLAATRGDTELVRHGAVRTDARRTSAGTGPPPTAAQRRAGGGCPDPPTVGHLH